MNQNPYQKIQNSVSNIIQLNDSLEKMSILEKEYKNAETNEKFNQIKEQQRKIIETYKETMNSIDNSINLIDSAIKNIPNDEEKPKPSKKDIDSILDNFFNKPIKHKQPPISNDCGCYAYRIKDVSKDQLICVKLGDTYQLMAVLNKENDTLNVYNPYDIKMELVKINSEQWTHLPRFVPEKPLSRWEHAKNADVLAIHPHDYRNFVNKQSILFQKARVISRPSEQSDEEVKNERGYKLKYEDGEYVVPEKFVVTILDQWKES